MPARCSPPTTGLDTRGRCSFGGGGSIIECTGSIATQGCAAASSTSRAARHLAISPLAIARPEGGALAADDLEGAACSFRAVVDKIYM